MAELEGRARSRPTTVVAAATLLAVSAAPVGAQEAGAADPEPPRPPDDAAALYGRIAVAGSGEPLANAAVRLVGRERATLADSSGVYRFRELRPGEVTVRVTYLGARAEDRTVTLEAGEASRLDVAASRTAVEVAELQVEVRRHRRGKMAGFEERRKEGRGDYITREDIERMNPVRTTQIIRHEAVGVRVERTGPGEYRLMLGHGPDRCPPAVFLDGGLVPGFAVDDVHPTDLQAVEVYEGTEAPARYNVKRGCGVVLLWTRTGG